ncbi:hypothetical protein NKI98_21635 [Mesorhizobium sp. M0222]|uniref:hypothetical protein n=1 Tax=unclassified Mesorhizobium TaxID=325217 RepID=UPI0003CE94D1|nr:hypothetical protein [Mesorhizobium sp. LSHC414A00]ESX78249.1 hypothetical protein X757_09005 [Mesorhizobium sp. LSHC414A00]
MKIKLLVSLAGAQNAFSAGTETDWDDEDAIRLIDAGFALPVSETKIERAVATPAAERRKRDVASSDSSNSAD